MMDNFDNVDQMLQQLYENAVSKKSELESELRKLDATIEKLGVLYGAKTYTSDMLKSAEPVRRGRKPELNKAPRVVKEKKVKEASSKEGKRRVKQGEVRESCMNFLRAATPDSRSGSEILDYLVREEGYTRNNSLRSRVYALLVQLANDPAIPIRRTGRGVYAIEE